MVEESIGRIFIAGIQAFVAFAFTVLSVYTGTGLFDRLTRSIDEWKEIKRGNAAVGIVMLALVIAIVFITSPQIISVSAIDLYGIQTGILLTFLFVRLISMVITLVLGVVTIFIAIRLFDHITVDIDENKELKRGNVALALVLSALILGIALIARDVIFVFMNVIGLERIMGLVG